MKITKSQLKQIIREEMVRLNEAPKKTPTIEQLKAARAAAWSAYETAYSKLVVAARAPRDAKYAATNDAASARVVAAQSAYAKAAEAVSYAAYYAKNKKKT